MPKPKYILITSLAICLLGFGLFAVALAQEDATTNMPPTEEEMLPTMDGEMGPPPEEVSQDMDITMEDFGTSEAIIKPDSIFHPFKRLGRNITEMLTFDPVKDAELKLKHANQELSEMKQLIDEDGIENIDPDDLVDSVEWFGSKIEKIKDASERLKEEKTDNPEEIEAFLNEFTDKQFKEHKILEGFHKGVTDYKEELDGSEEAFVSLRDNQDNVFKHFGETLTTIDDPEKIPDRLSGIASQQEGSDFKLIKAAEILEKLEEQVPDEAKEAIEKAQEKTFEKLQEDVGELPAIVRAEKFEEYTNALPGDETVQLGIFEKIKQLPDIPQDILEKIEEVKEFAVKRFEDKIEKFEQPEVKDRFFANLQGNDLDDIMALEELKARISAKQDAIRAQIDQKHNEGVEAFKKHFTDAESQKQAERFQRLVKEMTTNPNPKTLKLINELEKEVAQDPEKKAFIENIKGQAKTEFENKFRQEGDRFFDRMATFNPEDVMIFREFEEERFFDPQMMDQFYDHQTDRFKEHIQGINNPEMFNRFDERMRFAPPEVINMIKVRDNEFGDVMQFKARKMMEMELELKEREMRFKMDQNWRATEDDFQIKLRQVQSDDEKARLYEERRQQDLSLMDKEFEDRKMIMEMRFENDPFCDAMCQEFQRISIEQELQNKKWNLQEDARMREFELEMQMNNQQQHDPFAGKCNDPRSCMDYCNNNPNAPGCGMHMPPIEQTSYMAGPPLSCPEGQISVPRGSGWECVFDPYYRPPTFFQECPPGHFWNEGQGFCQFDEKVFMPDESFPRGTDPYPPAAFCGPGEFWDDIRGCVRDDFQQCGPGEYFDFFEQHCKRDQWQSCPPGEYWDPGRNGCVRDVFEKPAECPTGYFFDFYKGHCVAEYFCGMNEYWDESTQSCKSSGTIDCPAGQYWNPSEMRCIGNVIDTRTCTSEWTPVCGIDNITYTNDCHANQNNMAIQYRGECTGIDTPPSNSCGDGYCEPYEHCPEDCEIESTAGCNYYYDSNSCTSKGCVWCSDTNACYNPGHSCSYMTECNNNNVCEYSESAEFCPNDCGGGGYEYPGDAGSCPGFAYSRWDQNGTRYCQLNTQRSCNYNYPDYLTENNYSENNCPAEDVSSCNYNGICDSNETSTTCPSECGGMSEGCGSYTNSSSCYADPACGVWCEGESSPYSCFHPNYICVDTAAAGNCNYNNICDSNETMESCSADCYTSTCPSNSYTTSAGACDYAMCSDGCVFDNQGCPSGCMDTSSYICGNNVCDSGETTTSCPADCGDTTTMTCDYNGSCDYNETMESCPTDCSSSAGGCGSYTDSSSCYADSSCGVWCEGESSPYSCFSPGHVCGDTTTADCYTFYDNSACTSAGCIWCSESNTCNSSDYTCGPSYVCGDGYCDPAGEDEWSCSSDCYVAPSYVCGDGYCEGDEYCPEDCESNNYEEPYYEEPPASIFRGIGKFFQRLFGF